MAVTRITAPRRWHLKAAALVKGTDQRLYRELKRAADRPGKTAEVHGEEASTLLALLPGDPLAEKACEEIRLSEAREAARPRARDIVMRGLAQRGFSYDSADE